MPPHHPFVLCDHPTRVTVSSVWACPGLEGIGSHLFPGFPYASYSDCQIPTSFVAPPAVLNLPLLTRWSVWGTLLFCCRSVALSFNSMNPLLFHSKKMETWRQEVTPSVVLKWDYCPHPARCAAGPPFPGICGTWAPYDGDTSSLPYKNVSFVSPFKQQDMVSHSSLCSSWLLLCYCVFSGNGCVWSNVCLCLLMCIYIWMDGGWLDGWVHHSVILLQ